MNSTRLLPEDEIKASSSPVSLESSANVTFWLAIIIVIAGGFRFAQLSSKSLWLDEAASVWIARPSFASVWHDLLSRQMNNSVYALYMGLYYAFLHFWIRFGESEFWLRLPSALCGVATVPFLYALGSRLFSKRVGLAAALLLAVQPVHIAYSQEARSYSVCVFLSVAGFYFFVRAIEEGAGKWWVLYVVSIVLAIYSHLFAVFLLPAQWSTLLFLDGKKTRLKSAIVSTAMVLLFVVPVFGLAILKDLGKIPWGSRPGIGDILHAVQTLTGAGVKFPIYVVVLAMAGVSFYQAWRDQEGSDQRWRYFLLWSWFLIPVASIVLAALWKPPLFPRYFIVSLPASTLLAAVGVSRLRPNMAFAAATMVLAALFVPAVFTYYSKPKEDWRGATAYILTHSHPEDGIVFYQVYGQQPFDYYRRRMGQATESSALGPVFEWPGGSPAAYKMPTVWLVIYGIHPRDTAEAALLEKTQSSLESGHVLVGRRSFNEIEIRCYSNKMAQINSDVRR